MSALGHSPASALFQPGFDRGLMALQGPLAANVLGRFAPQVADMRFMGIQEARIAGVPCIVSRSGYTGEDGFEIGCSAEEAETVARALLASSDLKPIGLGARDSLRLEAGLCLYGADITNATSPIEAALEWSIQALRRPGGERAGGYPGADRISEELTRGAARRRVGLKPDGRTPVRAGAAIFSPDSDTPVGEVTSGCFGPTINAPVAMGYVPAALATPGTALFAEVRGARVALAVTDLPFVQKTYKR